MKILIRIISILLVISSCNSIDRRKDYSQLAIGSWQRTMSQDEFPGDLTVLEKISFFKNGKCTIEYFQKIPRGRTKWDWPDKFYGTCSIKGNIIHAKLKEVSWTKGSTFENHSGIISDIRDDKLILKLFKLPMGRYKIENKVYYKIKK